MAAAAPLASIQTVWSELELPKNRTAALTYKKKGYLDYMLLTDIDNIVNDTMLDPYEYRSWSNKIQTCGDD